jgi:hypothetical protein
MNPEKLMTSLVDHLGRERIEIDMMRVTGPDFKNVDNRLLSLQLVKNHLTHAALFDPQGNVLQPSEVFYKKNILLLRGRFRPFTKVNTDMLKSGNEQFKSESSVDPSNIVAVSELTLSNLRNEGEINEKDFLDRAELLCSLGQTVLISDYHEYYRLVAYLSKFTKQKIGIIIGILNLAEIFNEKYYVNLKGGILEAFATLFSRNVKMYVYPSRDQKSHEYLNCTNFELSPNLKDLYEYLIVNDKLEDIKDARLEYLSIISDNVLNMIKNGVEGWEIMVPEPVAAAIKEKKLFSYSNPRLQSNK